MEAEITAPLVEQPLEAEAAAKVPPWREQLTVRAVVAAAMLGFLFCVIMHRLNLSVGIFPSFNVAAGMLGFVFVKAWAAGASWAGLWSRPFTAQENTVVQTCVVACYGIAFSGGFGSYLLAMDHNTYDLVGKDSPGNYPEDVKDPSLGWIIGFLFLVSFLGLFSLVPLSKVMLVDYKLTYPSGMATGLLINSFHTTAGAELARKQVHCLTKYLSLSFIWSCFKWFYSGVGNSCGFDNFPSLGLSAFRNTFYFDFSATYVGYGLICPHIVNCSLLLGAVVSWGFLWPFISSRAGDWYPIGLGIMDMKGLYGYKVSIAISVFLGDGLYNLLKLGAVMFEKICCTHCSQEGVLPVNASQDDVSSTRSKLEKMREKMFMDDQIPSWFAFSGYLLLAAISIATIPAIFPQLSWYLVLVSYIVAPAIAFCNSYATGLTNWSLSSTYGKVFLFIIASIVGRNGGVMAGLAACGVLMSILSTSSDLMQDFKTGYLTLSSPKSMFVSQLVGTAIGCVAAPLTFWLFLTAFDVGTINSVYKAPYAVIYREIAILGMEGFSALPGHCLEICCIAFILSIIMNIAKDVAPIKIAKYVPIPTAMAVPFYLGANFAIDMFVGSLILYIWEWLEKDEALKYAGAMAAGLICGDGIWTIPSAILSILKIEPPICMYFGPSTSRG